tara:strand:+ start:3568 stop:3888 length:321 start_codon:yes stop_codon:yes gene_type:complete
MTTTTTTRRATKKSNNYAAVMGHDLFENMPKAVIAAVAVSFASCGGDHFDGVTAKMVEEWNLLHIAGIVPQRPPSRFIKAHVISCDYCNDKGTKAAPCDACGEGRY